MALALSLPADGSFTTRGPSGPDCVIALSAVYDGTTVKQETLAKVNALLAKLAEEAGEDGVVGRPPAALASSVGLGPGLETARAMRALLARRRLENSEGGYRVVSTQPIEPGEPLAIIPQRRKRTKPGADQQREATHAGIPTYDEIGRAVVDRLIEVSRDAAELRAGRGTEERARVDSAERRAAAAELRVKELQTKLEMAESNLREVLRSASIAKTSGTATPIEDPEAQAVLRFLQSGEREDGE